MAQGSTMFKGRTVNVLLVEDDEIDAEAIGRAFAKQNFSNPIIRAHDGIEALAILRKEQGYRSISHPFLILLDLNMPRMGGLEFLEVIRNDKALKRCIVFVLTTSDSDNDRVAAYERHIAGYLVKSHAGDDFGGVTRLLDHYWRMVAFPSP